MKNILKLKSVDDAPIVRKFSVYFSLMSLLPFVILAAAFFVFSSRGEIKVDSNLFFWAVFIVGFFSFVGFVAMRKTFVNLMKVSSNVKDILSGNLSKRIDIKGSGNNEVAQLAHAFNEVVQQLENNIQQLEKSKATLQNVLLKVSSGASSADNIDAFLDLILETTVNALDGHIGMLLMLDETKKEFIVKSHHGLDKTYADRRIPVDEEVVGWVVKQKKPLLIPRLHKIDSAEGKPSFFEPPLICSPLVFRNQVIGAISISGKKGDVNFEEDELIILSNLGAQIALAMENARLNSDNQKTYLETVTALALAVEARDLYSRGHSDRVSEYSVKLAEAIGLSEQQIKTIKEAAQLHDVGKIGISDEILRKPAALNDLERRIIEQHPVIGEGIIVPLHGFSHLRDPIRHHHEWVNGEGYPDHLKGDEICIEARIMAITDSYDAMITDRPYRKGLSIETAKAELLKYKDIRYDPKLVDAFIQCMNI
ncbi:MAG: HD domain-containing phosphohydrolase [Candidatus Omnitrophota bacterium]